MLYTLTQEQLGFIHFPLGNLTKPEMRALARTFGLPVADKEESQEICFVGKGSYADFVAKRRPDVTRPGEIVDTDGEAHRRAPGAGPSHRRPAAGIGIAADGAALRAPPGAGPQPPRGRLAGRGRGARDRAGAVSLIDGIWPEEPFEAEAMVRYRGALAAAVVGREPRGSGGASALHRRWPHRLPRAGARPLSRRRGARRWDDCGCKSLTYPHPLTRHPPCRW